MDNLINYLHEVLDENSTLKPFEEAERLPIFCGKSTVLRVLW